jgi:hypothetical protein
LGLDPLPQKQMLGLLGDACTWLISRKMLNSGERVDARKARVIELRFFGGLTVEESAPALSADAPLCFFTDSLMTPNAPPQPPSLRRSVAVSVALFPEQTER